MNLKAIPQGLRFKEQAARVRALAEYKDFLTSGKMPILIFPS
jgi:hypothetical protein